MTDRRKPQKNNSAFSKTLDEMRNLAIAITKDKRIRVKYIPEQPTSAFNMENFEISLSLQSYPDFVKTNPRLFRKILDGDMAHECVPKGTQILTTTGFKPIEQVKIGDMVLSEGRFVKVLETIHRDYKGELITIKAHGILPFSVTSSHPIRMIRGKHREKWTNATFLRKGDYLQIPKLSQTVFTFDNTFMEFLGVFIGDGHANPNSTITIALETEQDAKYVLALVQKLYQKGRIYKRETHFEVSFDNKDLSDYLRLECYLGTGHSQKQIPNFVYLSSQENIKAFYKGYYLADGSKEGEGKRITTVSYDLAIGLQKLLTKIGIFVTVHKVKREGETTIQNRVVHQNDRYAITEKNSYAKQDGSSFWVKIRKTERTQINSEVFNLRTESETYEINNVLVHNCGHLILTHPNWEFFNNWATKIKRQRGYYKLAHEICYSEDTEVLTKEGWKLFEEITLQDEIATINKDGYIEYQKPTKVIRQQFDGEMLHWGGANIDEKVTPDHEMIIRKNWKKNFERIPASVLAEYKAKECYEFQIGNFKWRGTSPTMITVGDREMPIKDGLSLIAWFVSEGHLGYYTRSYRTEISNTNSTYRNEIRSLISKYWNFVESPSNINFTISNKSLFEFLEKMCGKGSHNKKIPQFIKNLSPELIEYFLNVLFKGDGNFRNKKIRLYRTVSTRLANDVQELILKIGLSGVVISHGEGYTVTVNHEKLTPCCTNEVKREDYHGIVYDVRVPNHTLIVRRNGKVVLGSNCNIVEDKRVNHFIILRYRFDVGKRLLLANLILKDMIDNTIEKPQIQTSTILPKGENLGENPTPDLAIQAGQQEGIYMVAILCNEGLYEAKCTELWNKLSPEATKDTKEALRILEGTKYQRVKLDIIRSCQAIYDLVAKHLKADYTTKEYVVSRRGGNLKGKISDKLKQLLEQEDAQEQAEEDKKKHLEDLQKGSGAGEGSFDIDSEGYVKINGILWYGTVGDLEKTLKESDKLEVLTVETYREKSPFKSWKNKKITKAKIIWKEAKLINHGTGFVYEIALRSGRKIKVTANHNLFKKRFSHSCSVRDLIMTRTDSLKVGDSIAVPSILPIKSKDFNIEDDMVYLIGLWFADGNYSGTTRHSYIQYTLNSKTKQHIIKRIKTFCKNHSITCSITKLKCNAFRVTINAQRITEQFKAYQCIYPKIIPNWVFIASNRQIRAFLNGYEDGDGSKNNKKSIVQISCVERKTLEDLQTLYLRLGITTNLNFKRIKGTAQYGKGTYRLETNKRKYPEITYRQIKSITPIGYVQIYDFSVPITERFIANNILAHNTGEEIPAPEPDFEAYSKLLDECKPQITELLNQLKKKMKPRVQRDIFQKRGKMMSPIVPRIYTNSFRGTVRNVYLRTTTKFEKEQVKIGFMFDYSGSVDRKEALKITTILNEVFGHYVADGDFAITAFGADCQKVKVFNETFENTRARIGAISVNAGGTEMSVLLESFLKMFNCFKDVRKALVIASDFSLCGDEEQKCMELLTQYAKMGVEVYLIGFCDCDEVSEFASKITGLRVQRTKIKEISELPSAFLSVWTNYQK